MSSTVIGAQTHPGDAREGFHLAIARSDRASAASVLAASVTLSFPAIVTTRRDGPAGAVGTHASPQFR